MNVQTIVVICLALLWMICAKEWAWLIGILVSIPVLLLTGSSWITIATGLAVVVLLKLARKFACKLRELSRKVEAKKEARLVVKRGDPDWVEPGESILPKWPNPPELRTKNSRQQ